MFDYSRQQRETIMLCLIGPSSCAWKRWATVASTCGYVPWKEIVILWMDAIHVAPPKKPWNDDSPVNTSKQWCDMASEWCRIVSIHSITSSDH